MQLLPIKTPLIQPGDDVVEIIRSAMRNMLRDAPACHTEENCDSNSSRSGYSGAPQHDIENNDILVISSKAIATAEGRVIDLKKISSSDDARRWSKKCGRSPEFCQAVLDEVKFRGGVVKGAVSGAMVTELSPAEGTIITANAGLDESNIGEGFAVGWPEDPVGSAREIRDDIEPNIAVVITDSCVRPRRWGLIAFALTVAGIDPLQDEAGKEDLYGRPLRITKEATADQLATAANMLMGNAGASVPAVIVRDHNVQLSDYAGWVPGIAPEEDLFSGIL